MNEPDKYSRIPVQSLAEDLADYVWEVMIVASRVARKRNKINTFVDIASCVCAGQNSTFRTVEGAE